MKDEGMKRDETVQKYLPEDASSLHIFILSYN